MNNLGLELPKKFRLDYSLKDKNSPAWIQSKNADIHINTASQMWTKPGPIIERLGPNGDRWLTIQSDTEGVIHEIGHWYHRQEIGFDEFRKTLNLTQDEQAIAMQISRYAATQQVEFVAEVFVELARGRKVSREVLDLYEKFGGVFPRAAEPVVEIPWAPTMTRSEAEAWVKGSQRTEDFLHATAEANVEGLKKEGWDLSRSQWGRAWGNGVYVTDEARVADMYAGIFNPPSTLKIKVKLDKVLNVDLGKLEQHIIDGNWPKQPILESLYPNLPQAAREAKWDAIDNAIWHKNQKAVEKLNKIREDAKAAGLDGKDQNRLYNKAQDEMMKSGELVRSTSAETITQLLQSEGYDSLYIFDPKFNKSVGGSQLVIFDPRKVVIINE
jgi:hypothetical protein